MRNTMRNTMKLSELKLALQAEFEKLARLESKNTYRSMMVLSGRFDDMHTYTLTLTHKGGKASVLIVVNREGMRSYGVAVATEQPYEEALYAIRHQLLDHHKARKFWGWN